MAEGANFELSAERENVQTARVLMRHCEQMKRQETRLRLATALLFATFLATLLWLQFRQQTTVKYNKVAFLGAQPQTLKTEERSAKGQTIHLASAKQNCTQEQSKEQLIHWEKINDGLHSQNFNLTNNLVLHIFTKGLYLINLRIFYRIASGQCQQKDKHVTLEVNVKQHNSNYKLEREVITGMETMPCTEYWFRSVTLSRVTRLEADTSLRVRINQDSCRFILWGKKSFLEVTYI